QVRTDAQTDEAIISYEERTYNPPTGLEYSAKENTPFLQLQCYPNPSTSAVTFQYYLAETQNATLAIYNILGQEVRTIVDEKQTPGQKMVHWDGCDSRGRILSSGIYFGYLTVGTRVQTRKVILLK
ncbi:MAG: T9SS type A sorting domain-containing protein, partial [candidate division WOR-3 bacterium]